MKIAILTYYESSDNYGQILQCFALQQYLLNLGHDAYLVKYSPKEEHPSKQKRIFNILKKIINITYIKKYIASKRLQREELELKSRNEKLNSQREFELFRKKYIKSTDNIYHSIDELKNNPPDADIYVCGSDQVWRDSLKQDNVAGWYLQFGKKDVQRISYAASIGRNIAKDEEEIFIRYLSAFDAISLREKKARDYCKTIGFHNAELVCDPTILLTSDYYQKNLKTKAILKEKPYVFFYILNIVSKDEFPWDVINQQIHNRGWEIKSVCSSGYYQARNIIPETDNILATVPEWIELIQNAEFIITSSFHGAVFSILFHKPFIVLPLKGDHADANDRIKSLLNELDLNSQLCFNGEDIIKAFDFSIDWDSVEDKIALLRQSGEKFIERNFV